MISPLTALLLVMGAVVAMDMVPVAQAADDAKARVYLIGLPGATWGSCPAIVRATISALPGVASVTFDREKLKATVTMKDANSTLNKKEVSKALLAKGEKFRVESFREKK
jgi:copper chaperone CopZ